MLRGLVGLRDSDTSNRHPVCSYEPPGAASALLEAIERPAALALENASCDGVAIGTSEARSGDVRVDERAC